ncbi:hypothetical protein NDU88_010424 [Pleurodeles waltl]|uniref:Uncharacterized protein n=1 Tax=Pleurodeles waltl TaxID=8319 RepID=A0AAV7PYT0_PLEWA|nr:hypothetical protein NDU88_010424 [Pleurodeles waltl]
MARAPARTMRRCVAPAALCQIRGSADPEAGTPTMRPGSHPPSVGSGRGNTLGFPRVAPLSAHLASAGALMGPSSAGATAAQHQAAPSRSRLWRCVRDGGAPCHPKKHQTAVPGASRPPPDSTTRAPGRRHHAKSGGVTMLRATSQGCDDVTGLQLLRRHWVMTYVGLTRLRCQ